MQKICFILGIKPFYKYGIIHGDPHLGNYTVQNDHSINLFDFGCMRVFKGKFIQGVIDLYFALQKIIWHKQFMHMNNGDLII